MTSKRLAVALLLAASAAGVLALVLLSGAEVLEKGQLLPYTEGQIYKVRFGGGLVLYVEPDLKPNLDLLNAYLLTGLAFVALSFASVLAFLARRDGAAFRFFTAAFFGASYLVADELLGIHETLGHNLQFLRKLPLVERPDDVVLLLTALLAAAVLARFRGTILASKPATALFATSFGLFLLSALGDLLSLPFEEAAEVLAAVGLVAAMVVLGLHHARAALGPREGRASDQPSPRAGTR